MLVNCRLARGPRGKIFRPPLERHQLRRGRPGLCAPHVARVLDGAGRVILLQVGPADGRLQALAPRVDGADGDLAAGGLDGAARLLEESAVPASRLQTPRAPDHAPFHHHGPDADEAVRLGARADAQKAADADGSY